MDKIKTKRSCDGCTKCCEGWLMTNVYGYDIRPGIKCHFLGKSCTIYNNRPDHPCKAYHCLWLEDENNELPEWLKPDLSDVIITRKMYGNGKGIHYWDVSECGKPISAAALNWILNHAYKNRINLSYMVNGARHFIGSPEFLKFAFT